MDTWIRLLVWMLIGLDIYLVYGAKHSHLGDGTNNRKGMRIGQYHGLALAGLLVIAGFLHQYALVLMLTEHYFIFPLLFAAIHLGLYLEKSFQQVSKAINNFKSFIQEAAFLRRCRLFCFQFLSLALNLQPELINLNINLIKHDGKNF